MFSATSTILLRKMAPYLQEAQETEQQSTSAEILSTDAQLYAKLLLTRLAIGKCQ